MTREPSEVVTAGEIMGLLLAQDDLPLRRACRFLRGVAGAEGNVAIGLARLGHRVSFVGRVGADAAGGWVRDALASEGIDIAALHTDPARPTGLLLRDYPAGRALSVSYFRHGSAGSALSPTDLPDGLLDGVCCVFLSGITPMLSPSAAAFTERLLDLADATDLTVIVDPNVRPRLADQQAWRSRLTRMLERADTLLAGRDELAFLGLPESPSDLLTDRRRTVVIRDGGATAVVADVTGTVHAEARRVPVVDPVGAGDAFCAGWISAALRGLTAPQALNEALYVASLVVATPTDTAGLPTAADRARGLQENRTDVDR